MTTLFLERSFSPPISRDDVLTMAIDNAGCFGIHQVDWWSSLLSTDGRRLVCRFATHDMESARIAMRQSNIDMQVLWRGDVFDAPGITEADVLTANVLVERAFDEAVGLQQIQDIEDAGIGCLEVRGVRFMRTYFSSDKLRMICLYAAPDSESVRQSQREAGVPFQHAWSFQTISPADLSSVTC